MKNIRLNFFLSALIICVNAPFCAHAENVSTPLFTADIRNVITMYAAPDAQTFYLHTEDSLYTVSRDGQILSITPSKVKYGCCEDSVLYLHEEYDQYLLTQSGDTILRNDQALLRGGWLNLARFMCRKDGVFYWWRGVQTSRDRGDRASCFIKVTDDGNAAEDMGGWNNPISGILVTDDMLFVILPWSITGVTFSFSPLSNKNFGVFYDNKFVLEDFDDPIGLVCIGDWLYIWSNSHGDQTMYTLPRSYLVEMATGIQSHYVDGGPSPLFDLQGRPVTQPQTGIYIQDGKKILIE